MTINLSQLKYRNCDVKTIPVELQEGVNDIHRFWHGQQLSDFASAEVVGPGATAEAGAEDVNIHYAGEGKNMVEEATHKGSK